MWPMNSNYGGSTITGAPNIAAGATVNLQASQSIFLTPGTILAPNASNFVYGAIVVSSSISYEYAIKDHLGNTRITYSDLDNNGVIAVPGEILQENHVACPVSNEMSNGNPFGYALDGPYMNHTNSDNLYLYNGKELNNDHGIGLYDYGARWYDAGVARWTTVDALADHPNQNNKSPYAYAWNNPVNLNDPDGNCPTCPLAVAGGIIGGLIGGGIEAGRQLIRNGSISEWKAVGGSATQGAITGAAAGFAGALTSGIINREKFGKLIGHAFTGAIIGGAIGGVIGGIDATFKDHNFLDGKGIPTERYLTGTGHTPEESKADINQVIATSEVHGQQPSDPTDLSKAWEDIGFAPSRRGHNTGSVNSSNFQGKLNVKVRAWPMEGESFYINVNGKEVFNTKIETRRTLQIKTGQSIGWGIKGKAVTTFLHIGNNVTASFSATPTSYLIIKGTWRSWGSFFAW